MRRTTPVLVLAFAALCVQCEERHVDEAFVCFVPPNCECPLAPSSCDPTCDGGQVPADEALRVVAVIGDYCNDAEFEDLQCHVVQTGDHELTIESSWRDVPSKGSCYGESSIGCVGVDVDCGETPVLGEGTWTVKYGGRTYEFVVPAPEHSLASLRNCFIGDVTTGE